MTILKYGKFAQVLTMADGIWWDMMAWWMFQMWRSLFWVGAFGGVVEGFAVVSCKPCPWNPLIFKLQWAVSLPLQQDSTNSIMQHAINVSEHDYQVGHITSKLSSDNCGVQTYASSFYIGKSNKRKSKWSFRSMVKSSTQCSWVMLGQVTIVAGKNRVHPLIDVFLCELCSQFLTEMSALKPSGETTMFGLTTGPWAAFWLITMVAIKTGGPPESGKIAMSCPMSTAWCVSR